MELSHACNRCIKCPISWKGRYACLLMSIKQVNVVCGYCESVKAINPWRNVPTRTSFPIHPLSHATHFFFTSHFLKMNLSALLSTFSLSVISSWNSSPFYFHSYIHLLHGPINLNICSFCPIAKAKTSQRVRTIVCV